MGLHPVSRLPNSQLVFGDLSTQRPNRTRCRHDLNVLWRVWQETTWLRIYDKKQLDWESMMTLRSSFVPRSDPLSASKRNRVLIRTRVASWCWRYRRCLDMSWFLVQLNPRPSSDLESPIWFTSHLSHWRSQAKLLDVMSIQKIRSNIRFNSLKVWVFPTFHLHIWWIPSFNML